jgi:hypothetical protein
VTPGDALGNPQTLLTITGLGQFSAALAMKVNKALVRGVHRRRGGSLCDGMFWVWIT